MATALLHGVLIVEAAKCRMIWHAMLMFLLGLVTGLAEQRFTNVRMGLSARLEGVMNGTFLMAVGAIWNEMRLSQPAKTSAFWTALYGTRELANDDTRRDREGVATGVRNSPKPSSITEFDPR